MRNSIKFLGALAVAGLVAAGGSAFTGAGLNSSVPADQFIGGSVTQTVSGATLESTKYVLTANNVTGINLVFDAAAVGKILVVKLNTTTYTCTLGIAPVMTEEVVTGGSAACTASPGVVNTDATSLSVRVTEAAE